MQEMRASVEPLMNRAWSELAKPDADGTDVMRLFDEAAEKRRGFRRELAASTLSFLAILAPEQRAKFVALARQRPWEQGHPHDSP
jgi:Spy/CpxP family protein refolding chaperone